MEEKKEVNNNIKVIPTSYKYVISLEEGEMETQSPELAYIIDKLNQIEELLKFK